MKTLLSLLVVFMGFNATSIAQLPSYVSPFGLQGWWPFCGSAADSSGNGYHGNPANVQLAIDRFGLANECYLFNDTSSRITIPLEQTNITEYTVSAWFKTTQGGPLVSGGGKIGSPAITLNVHTALTGGVGEAHYVAEDSALSIGQRSQDSTYDDNQWHHIVGVYNGASGPISYLHFNLYVDTVNVAQVIQNYGSANAPINNDTTILFGAHRRWPGGVFNGYIDDIGIWNRALLWNEIVALYTGTPPCLSTEIIDSDNLIKVSVYPNPTNEQVIISTKSSTHNDYFIADMSGRRLLSGKLSGKSTIVNLSEFAAGVYFVRIDGCQKWYRIVKQ